ncbi:MAG: thiamine-phosphate kinase [Euryarchaeota archaeon]|nr:thiamine-phosphate kinase [Euryarchaeota archaeon]
MRTLAEVGEKAAIDTILRRLDSSVVVGPGDDAAAIRVRKKLIVASTDIVSRVSHLPEVMTPKDIGWFVSAINFSDIAAMGARPLGILLSFCLPGNYLLNDLENIMEGAQECALSIGTEILGGDTKEGTDLVIAGSALGEVDEENILLRQGAKHGDLLAVTGTIGLASAGYVAAMNGYDSPEAINALIRPIPRIREGIALSASGAVTSAIDITDGLAYSIHELSNKSGVHFKINWDDIPIRSEVSSIAVDMKTSLDDMVLYYGGDYELLFTIRPHMVNRLRTVLRDRFSIIGQAEGHENVLMRGEEVLHLESRGYEHFKR